MDTVSGEPERSFSPPRSPGPLGAPRPGEGVIGVVGFALTLAATIGSPTAMCGIPALVLVPMGLAGLIFSALGLRVLPRWPAICGLVLGTLCVLGWVVFFIVAAVIAAGPPKRFGLSLGQYAAMSTSAFEIFEQAEQQRNADGTPAATFDWSNVSAAARLDAWASPFRYARSRDTKRGYTFFSDGPDRQPRTSDDIDLGALSDGNAFALPPVSVPLGR